MTTVDILTHINILYFVSNVSAENSRLSGKLYIHQSPKSYQETTAVFVEEINILSTADT